VTVCGRGEGGIKFCQESDIFFEWPNCCPGGFCVSKPK